MSLANACSCGGRLKAATIRRPSLEPLFGVNATLDASVPGHRCDKCGEETFDGAILERMLFALVRTIVLQGEILSPDAARFIRKAVLALTQEELAKRMGINKITISDWERGATPLSKEHDYELRGMAVSAIIQRLEPSIPEIFRTLVRNLVDALTGPRLDRSRAGARKYLVSASDLLVPA